MINENVWLSKDNWYEYRDLNSGVNNTGFFTTSWNGSRGLGSAVYHDYINPENNLDTSNIFWAINKECIFFKNAITLTKYTYENDTENVTIYQDEIAVRGDIPVWITIDGGSYPNGLSPRYYGKNFSPLGKWNQSKSTFLNWNYGDMTSGSLVSNIYNPAFINDFNYKRTVLLIYLTVSGSKTGDTYNFTYDEYFNNSDYVNRYPYIRDIYYRMYIEDEGIRKQIGFVPNFIANMPITTPGSEVTYGLYGYYNDYYSYLPNFCVRQTNLNVVPFDYTNTKMDMIKKTANTNGAQFYIFNYFEGDGDGELQVIPKSNGEVTICKVFNISKEDILKNIAYLGFWFTTNETSAETGVMGVDPNLYIPEIKNGVTTGKYASGVSAKEYNNFTWKDDMSNNSNYTLPNEDINFTPTTFNYGIYGTMKYFFLTPGEFTRFNDFINQWKPSGEQLDSDFKGVNPTEYIQQVIYYPYYTLSTNQVIGNENIILGSLDTEIQGLRINNTYGTFTEFSSIDFRRYFNDFRDFEPYTSITLYTLFGNIELSPSMYIGHKLTIRYTFDIMFGSGVAYILRDGVLVSMLTGAFGIKIPLTATMAGTYQNTISQLDVALSNKKNSRIQGTVASAIGMFTGMASGNPLLFLGSVVGGYAQASNLTNEINALEYQISHTNPDIGVTGSASSNFNIVPPYEPYVIISRAKTIEFDAKYYGENVGYSCLKTGLLKDFKGFTVCTNINTEGLSCTAQIKAIIQQLCRNGIYL